jgi:GR25 family glycosyltransferase involved in LPS biosynthesis
MDLGVDIVYVINLERHSERKAEMIKLLDGLEVNYEIITAIEGRDIGLSRDFLKKTMHKQFYDPGGILTKGVVGCAMSHHKAWDAFIKSDYDSALFLEDDIVITDEFDQWVSTNRLDEAINDLDNLNWGICFYGKTKPDVITLEDLTPNVGVLKPFNNQNWCAHAYRMTKNCAQWCHTNLFPLSRALDVFLECVPFKVLTFKNSLFIQNHMLYEPPYSDVLKLDEIPDEYRPSTLEVEGLLDVPIEYSIPEDIYLGMVIEHGFPVYGIDYTKLKIKDIEFDLLKIYLKI